MNVAAVQLDIVWENKAANYARVRQLLTGIQPGTLVVLPEMFATGFTMNLEVAEDTGSEIAKIATEYRVNLLAGVVRDRRNEAVLFDIDGREVGRYAKMHPFKIAGEACVPGEKPVVFVCGEFRVAPAVCYDLRFPELFRAVRADVWCVIANWPTPRVDHWLTLLKARAIENQAYVVGVNRCGRDPGNEYPGRSQIIGPRGEILAEAGAGEGVIQATLDLSAMQAYRREFPVLP